MDGITLSRAEFLTLMNAVKAPPLLGIDQDELIPADKEEHKSLILQGIEQFKQRGWLEVRDGIHVLEPGLVAMGTTIAYPELVTQVLHNDVGHGARRFLYYQAEMVIVEHTMPAEDQYRLATIPTSAGFIQRLAFVLSGTEIAESASAQFSISQDQFFALDNFANNNDHDGAISLLESNQVDSESAALFVNALENPSVRGTVAFLRPDEQEIEDARELAFVQTAESAWAIYQETPGQPAMIVATVSKESLTQLLLDLFMSLVQAA